MVHIYIFHIFTADFALACLDTIYYRVAIIVLSVGWQYITDVVVSATVLFESIMIEFRIFRAVHCSVWHSQYSIFHESLLDV